MKHSSSTLFTLARNLISRKLFRGGVLLLLLALLFELAAVSSVLSNPVIVATKEDFLTVDIDADNFADPGDTIRYTNWVTNTGSTNADSVVFNDTIDNNTTLVAGSLRTTPIARNDSYASLGNVGITVPPGSGVLTNDNDPDGQSVSVVAAAGGTANGGAFAIGADGSFSYRPPAGFEGTDSFTYAIQDSDTNQDPATVFIVVNEVIWFIDNSQSSSGNGTLFTPYNSISAFNSGAADEAGDIIFVYSGSGNYTSGLTLLNNQILIGQGATASIASIAGITVPPHSNTLPATGGSRPTITTSSGDGVVVGQNNTLRGFNVGNTAGVGISDNGGTVGAFLVSEVAISGTGGGIEADNGGVLAVTLDSLSASSSSDEGIDLENVGGSFAVTGTSGTLNMTGVPAVVIDGNPSLFINSLTFQSVSSTNAAHGISIRDTTGNFTVTGTGAANSGGTLSGHSAEGVFLNNTANISLTDMVINQSATNSTQGIDATNVNGLTLVRTTITAGSGNSYAMLGNTIRNWTATSSIFDGGGGSVANIDGTRITNLLGTNTLTDSTFRNGKDINLLIENNTNAGGPDTITISGSSFSNSAGGDHLQVEADGTANLKLVVNASTAGNSTFSGTGQDGMQLEAEGNATLQAVITQATISGNLGSAVNLGAVVNGHLIARVHNLTGLTSDGTNVLNAIGFDNSHIEVIFENNTITLGNNSFNGIRTVHEGNGILTARIHNNTISGPGREYGIYGQARGGNGTLNTTITNNTVNLSVNPLHLDGIGIEAGSSSGTDTNTVCLNMANNNSTADNFFDGYYLRHRPGNTFRLQDFAGPATTVGITTWVNTTKSNTGTVFVTNAAGFTAAPAACATPTVPVASIPASSFVVAAPTGNQLARAEQLMAEIATAPEILWANNDNLVIADKGVHSSKRAAAPTLSGETINGMLGTLNPGQQVRITFDITIDNPQSPVTNSQVCNQGVVSGNNFANVATDDLDVGGSADPTCTPLAPGTIIIAKDQLPDGSSSFGFSSNIPGNATFNVSGDSSTTIHNVPPGSYTVTEDDPAAGFFALTGLSCDDGGSAAPSTTDTGTRTATVNLESGETVTCTFTNQRNSTILVQKSVVQGDPSNPGQTFDLNISLGNVVLGQSPVAPGSTPVGLGNLAPDTYTVNEVNLAPGWTLNDISCVNNFGNSTFGTFTPGDHSLEIMLAAGSEVLCTFTNTFNQAPVANDDSYTATEDTTLNVSAPGVLDNDTDADGDALTAVKDSDPSHGTLTLNGDDSFSYEPDTNYCGPDSFTYHANDGQADSNVATVNITVECVDDPPTVSVDVGSQTVQYSDFIGTVTVTASDVDSHPLSISDNAPSNLSTSGGCTASGDGTSCTWTLTGQVLVAADTYNVTFTISDAENDVTAGTQIVVTPENARVTFDGDNPVAVSVDSPGSDSSEPFTLVVHVQEKSESGAGTAPGDINLAEVTLTLEPIGPGSPTAVACTSTGAVAQFDYTAVLEVACDFSGVPVNSYTATATVGGGYYTGSGEDALVVFDASLGFTTGGGWFYWPGSEDPNTGYPGDRTTFGYTMSYNKKATKVKGNLVLIRHLPDSDEIYRIKSNALYGLALGEGADFGWAVFSGKATYLEPGMLEPVGNYEFTVYVEDHGTPGAGADRIWVQVRDRDDVVVPAMSMSPDAADNAVVLSGGNIVVPHENGGGRGSNR